MLTDRYVYHSSLERGILLELKKFEINVFVNSMRIVIQAEIEISCCFLSGIRTS
jgi:hypothetical protein